MADNFDNYSMKVQARVDLPSNKDIDAQIRKLEKSISKLKVSGQFDDNALRNLTNQLNTLKASITTANFSPTALTELTNQVNRALQNINIGNINVGNVGNQAQQVGQQIGNNIAQGVNSGVAKATSAMKSFSQLTDSMKSQKVLFDSSGLIDEKNTLNEIKKIYSEFGQVKITNKVFDSGELQSFKVNIEQVNGELKETRTFMMQLSENGKFFVFPDDVVKGTEKYVQHLNAAKNATNATGEALNAQNQRLAEQAKYYGKIKEETNHLYSLKQKLLSADELQTAELNKQIKSTKQRVTYNNQQIDKKGLRDDSLTREINDLVVAREKQLALSNAKVQDVANTKAQAQAQREANAVLKEQQSLQSQVNKIQHSTDITDLETKYKKFGMVSEEVENNLKELKSAQDAVFKAQGTDGLGTALENYNTKLAETKASVKELTTTQVSMSQRVSQMTEMQDWMRKNKAATELCGDKIDELIQKCKTCDAVEFNNIKSEFKEIKVAAGEAGKLGNTFFGGLIEQGKKFIQWTGISGSIMEVWGAIKRLISTSKELDSVMTDFTMATGSTENQLKSLTKTYNKLADELSSTTTDVITSATEWIKQGQSIADTETLITNAMILSKIGKLDSANATKYLTSAMKGYKVSVEDTLGVVDKLSAVDMASATDVGGLAEGMSEVAASADLAGVSMDKLLGYLAAIGETTQSGMSEVGTTLNAVFSRMGNIKLARLKDYDNNGEDLSNVETVLRGVGITLRDSANSFRDFDEVLDETASNWSNYSEVQQRAIASAFAGTHHMNEFIVLMENYDKALQYTETSLNSSGEAMEKFSAYEKSVEAHTQSFTNAVQGLADTAVDSGLINFFIDLGTTGIKALDGLMEAITPLGTIGVIGGGILGAKNAG